MPKPLDHQKRDDLVAAAATVLARRGVIDTSLRTLATELGTSARMLIHYFGSKEHLILEVLARQQRALIPETADVEVSVSVAAHRAWCLQDWWACTRGDKSETTRIVEQVFGAACGHDSPYRSYTAETLTLLTRNSQARLEALGMATRVAETRSRIAIAAFQGFVMEFFTADDPADVDDTFTRFLDEFLLAPFTSTSRPSPGRRSR